MKHLFKLPVLLTALALPVAVQGSATLSIDIGLITAADGVTPIADGSLLQLIVATSGTSFAMPTFTDFVGGSSVNEIIWSGAFDSSTSPDGAGSMSFLVPVDFDSDITVGDAFILRWYPTLTYASSPASPGGALSFGEYGYSTGDTDWVLPADGETTVQFLIDIYTVSVGGPMADSVGAATNTVIPEPSTTAAWLSAAVLLAVGFIRRRRA